MATANIAKWGNSLAVRIPAALADQYQFKEGTPVELVPGERGLVIRKPRYSLSELLEGITPENLHAEAPAGPAAGGEAW
ncbi:MAG: AbrB/MazE/SpoVT family DNA-binding domain-containing protein [Nitrospinota bacterium]